MSNASPRALMSRTRATYSAGCTRSSCSSLAAGASRGSQPSHSRLSSSASIARIRSARSGWPWPVSCSSEAGWRKNGGIRAGTVPARRERASPHRRRSCWRRRRRPLRRARGRRPGGERRAREPLAARADRELLGSGRDRRGAGPGRLARAARRRHARRRPRRPPARARCACSARSRPTACATSRSSASSSTQTAAATSRSGSRAGTRSAGSCTPAAPPPDGASRARSRRSRPRTSACEVLEPLAATAIATDEGRATGLALRSRDGASLTVSARAVILATGGMAALWQRTTNPRGAVGSGPQPRERGGRRAGRPRVHAVPPDRAAARRAARRLPRDRGGARRGRAALRLPGRALRGRARAPRRGGARHPHRARAHRRAGRLARHARRGRGALPQHRGRARRGGARPQAPPAPRGARRALHDGWNRHGPRGTLVAARPVRRRRVRVHRPARGEPAGIELTGRMPRVRTPRRTGRDRRARLGSCGGAVRAGGAREAR